MTEKEKKSRFPFKAGVVLVVLFVAYLALCMEARNAAHLVNKHDGTVGWVMLGKLFSAPEDVERVQHSWKRAKDGPLFMAPIHWAYVCSKLGTPFFARER